MALRSTEQTAGQLAARAQSALDRRSQLYDDIDQAVADAHAELEAARATANEIAQPPDDDASTNQ